MSRVIVAGGGIGGLATALAVADRGHRVVVLERRSEFTELGAGIQLAPNAFLALDRLGVATAVLDRAVHVDALRFMDAVTGEQVAALPVLGEYRARFGNPYAVVHRNDLYAPLLARCRAHGEVELRVDSPVVGYEQDGDGVAAVLADGGRVRGDALVGADGLRSAVRAQLVGDGEPRVSGHTIYRSVIPMEEVPARLRSDSVTLWAGPRWHFVHYPIDGGRSLNVAVTRDNRATEAVVGVPVEHERVLAEFTDAAPVIRELLALGREWRSWVLCDRDPVDRWADGRVVLLGDAAHPMLQYAAQGACMALEDAVHLGDLLAYGEPAAAFAAFVEDRRERTAAAQLVARAMGTRLYHPSGEAARARNAMLGGWSTEELYEKVAWLHGATRFGGSTGTPESLVAARRVEAAAG
ncbi:3-hydroxybenzoate 6-hydroxylase [Saccharothrix saharensis]|uniref:3-hydroxybenzoate 6-hydroxylase n=1 Tax=Saccharothrix saharensis TaxID=571190 RepID=A0A543J726_9PSEU|nr:3-hydroxybenzoate 6-monooxygenase [Saccharothrix saharensis]TQM78636.1 3-hydroxybenzoate 6-hydroxylase [Saccharothrix saharensis]